ncbi:outer membrane lipoprotein carrier protein LolA [Marivirga sp.]|uniref:LolA family protein n=1 Tax=Marivirga sp. TaxID=2018662 RepID=UPI002D80BD51|nr:outer membrane lipoprotein carrier protein LolA [Marivirga sp.]HET8858597.1 outer membrane lipoprotein carrier protein LolA [Marivirga sp.]
MRKLTIIMMLCIYSITATAQKDPKAKEILDQMSSKYTNIPGFTATFSQTLENKMENITDTFKGEIVVMGDKFKADVAGQLIVNNNETVWTYLREANEVTINNYDEEAGEMNPSKIYKAYQEGYKYIYMAGEGNAQYHVIDLVPEDKDESFYKIRLKIDKKTNLLDKWTIFDRAGNIFNYEVTNFKVDNSLTAEDFIFDPSEYPNIEVLDFR